MTRKRIELGRYGEQLALKRYVQCGYTLLDQNYRCRFGEIDLILCKGETLIFSEVRTKANAAYGTAEESVTLYKQQKIRRVSELFLLQHPQYHHFKIIQFDVISIFIDPKLKKAWINRIEQAF